LEVLSRQVKALRNAIRLDNFKRAQHLRMGLAGILATPSTTIATRGAKIARPELAKVFRKLVWRFEGPIPSLPPSNGFPNYLEKGEAWTERRS
jgi:hypothetical protein